MQCILLLLPPHVLFTGSSSETWSNGWLSLPDCQRQQCANALIAQETVLWDFCAVSSSWANQLPSDAVASFFFFFLFFFFCLRTHLTNVCRPAAGNNCFGRRPIVHFWTERAVPAGRVPDTSRHSPRLLIRICAGDRHSRGTLQPPEHRVDMVQASGTGLPSTIVYIGQVPTTVFSKPVPACCGGEHCRPRGIPPRQHDRLTAWPGFARCASPIITLCQHHHRPGSRNLDSSAL